MTQKQSILFIALGTTFLIGNLLAFAQENQAPSFEVYVYSDMAYKPGTFNVERIPFQGATIEVEMRKNADGSLVEKQTCGNNGACRFTNLPDGTDIYFHTLKNGGHLAGGLVWFNGRDCFEMRVRRSGNTIQSNINSRDPSQLEAKSNMEYFPENSALFEKKACLKDAASGAYKTFFIDEVTARGGKTVDEKGFPLTAPQGLKSADEQNNQATPPASTGHGSAGNNEFTPSPTGTLFTVNIYSNTEAPIKKRTPFQGALVEAEMREYPSGDLLEKKTCGKDGFCPAFTIPLGKDVYFRALKDSQHLAGGLMWNTGFGCNKTTFRRNEIDGSTSSYQDGELFDSRQSIEFFPETGMIWGGRVCMKTPEDDYREYLVSEILAKGSKTIDEKGLPINAPAGIQPFHGSGNQPPTPQEDPDSSKDGFFIQVIQPAAGPGTKKTLVSGAVVKLFYPNGTDTEIFCVTDEKGSCSPGLPQDKDVYFVAVKDSRRFGGSLMVDTENNGCGKQTYKLDSVSGEVYIYRNGQVFRKNSSALVLPDNGFDGGPFGAVCMGTDQNGYKSILIKYGGIVAENGMPLPIPEGAKSHADVDSEGNIRSPRQPPGGAFPPSMNPPELPLALQEALQQINNDVSLREVVLSKTKILTKKKTKGLTGKGIAFKVKTKSTWKDTIFADSLITTCNFGEQAYRIQRGSLKIKPGISTTPLFYEFSKEELKLVNAKKPFTCYLEIPTFLRRGEGENAQLKTDANNANNIAYAALTWDDKSLAIRSYSGMQYQFSKPFLQFQEVLNQNPFLPWK